MASKRLKITLPDGNEYTVSVEEINEDITSHITGLAANIYEYTGQEIKPTVLTDGSVVLNSDYTVTYSDNTAIGTGTVTVTGINIYKGSQCVFNFTIEAKNIRNHVNGLERSQYYYTGEEIKPTVLTDGTVTETTDYTITYKNNTDVGEGTVTVTGTNDYTGEITYTFGIVRDSIAYHVLGLEATEYTYTGEPITPELITDGTITKTTDYTVEYTDNTNVGTATVTVTGAGKYTGSTVLTFEIKEVESDDENPEVVPPTDNGESTDETTPDAVSENTEETTPEVDTDTTTDDSSDKTTETASETPDDTSQYTPTEDSSETPSE